MPFGDFIFGKKSNFSFGESSTGDQAEIILVCLGIYVKSVIVFFQCIYENYTSSNYCSYLSVTRTSPFNDTNHCLYTNTYRNGNVTQEISS